MNDINKRLVEENYDLVRSSLARIHPRYRNDYHGVASIALCESAVCRKFASREEFRRYAARSIANRIIKEQIKGQAQKRNGRVLSFADEGIGLEVEYASYKKYRENLVDSCELYRFYYHLKIQERRVIKAVADGYTYQEIGQQENLSASRIKQIVNHVRHKYKDETSGLH